MRGTLTAWQGGDPGCVTVHLFDEQSPSGVGGLVKGRGASRVKTWPQFARIIKQLMAACNAGGYVQMVVGIPEEDE